ncbi:hypothetical protein FDP41_009929 [Naegleria fowleri]|uniref:Cytochrome b5 heme-binding domain-containing protein n=1 Tax=Naegleria fowleri TaxID=5763 RepID=A0A6A5BAA1_NAEFO|nr:uncharacterized protein FDP41_009929 [Naegleria fowleri]KAF0971706.1 hypothetical protein FDP41_009929 [Naegleria fowleri]CAG4717563.1 unnamed protein product [Naegleria fowleri]
MTSSSIITPSSSPAASATSTQVSAASGEETTSWVQRISQTLIKPTSLVIVSIAALGAAYFVYKSLRKTKTRSITGDEYSDTSSDEESDESEEMEMRDFTLEELHRHSSTNHKQYVSVMGKVYDVTGSGFYGPNEVYSIYAGHEIGKALALNDVSSQHLDQFDLSDLTPQQMDHLTSMVEHFEMKYICVGTLNEWAQH